MRFVEKVLNLFFSSESILQGGGLYLHRWHIWGGSPDAPGAPKRHRWAIHKFEKDDSDRHCHGHPWKFTTFVLAGGYTDETWHIYRDDSGKPIMKSGPAYQRMNRWDWATRPEDHVHKVINLKNPTWTLVHFWPKTRNWGFYLDEGTWVYWRDYLGLPKEGPSPKSEVDLVV